MAGKVRKLRQLAGSRSVQAHRRHDEDCRCRDCRESAWAFAANFWFWTGQEANYHKIVKRHR